MQREKSQESGAFSQSSSDGHGRPAFHGGVGNYCLGNAGNDEAKAVVAPQGAADTDMEKVQE